jgi:tyrosyl-tRNA synthetase
VHPLVTKEDGTKFGKTESGTIWLDAAKTSPYEMYQFWLNTSDADVVTFLKYFTFLSRDEIAALEEATRRAPERRDAQRALARAVTALVHGEAATREAEAIGAAMFGGDVTTLTAAQLEDVCRALGGVEIHPAEAGTLTVLDLLMRVGAAESRGEARKLLAGGGVLINGTRVSEPTQPLTEAGRLHGRYWIVRKGRRTYFSGRLSGS